MYYIYFLSTLLIATLTSGLPVSLKAGGLVRRDFEFELDVPDVDIFIGKRDQIANTIHKRDVITHYIDDSF
jgi:hypothetical protein